MMQSILLAAVVTAVPFVSENLLKNGDFEEGFTSWRMESPIPAKIDSLDSFAGKKACRMLNISKKIGEIRQPFTPVAGKPHRLCFAWKGKNLALNAAEVRILLFRKNEKGRNIPWRWAEYKRSIQLQKRGGTFDWSEVDILLDKNNFPKEVKQAVLYFKFNQPNQGTLLIDNVSIRPVEENRKAVPLPKPVRKPALKNGSLPVNGDLSSGMLHADASIRSLWPEDGSFETGNRYFPLSPTEKAAWHGKRSLLMPAEAIAFDSAYLPVELSPGSPYSCMAFFRGNKAGNITIQLSSNTFQTLCIRRITVIPGQWQKVLLKISPQKNGGVFKIIVRKTAGMELLLDAFSLYRGRTVPEDYRSSALFFAGTDYLTTPGEVFFPEEKPLNRIIRLFNASGEKRTIRYNVYLQDLFGKKESVMSGTRSLKSGENAAIICSSQRKLSPGYYVLHIESESGSAKRSDDFPFLVAQRPEKKGTIGFACIHPMGPRVVGCRKGNHPVSPAALSRIGVKGVRDFNYRYVADFRNGQWKLPADIRILDYAGCNMDLMLSVQNAVKLKKIDSSAEAASFYQALMERCKEVKFWEIENEPDLGWKPFYGPYAAEYYGKYAKELTERIRLGKKDYKICGPGTSGEDFLHDGMPFLKGVSNRIGNSFNAMTIHPYTGMRFLGRDQEETTPEANQTYERLSAAKKSIPASVPLWCSEVGYALDLSEPCTGKTAKRHADYVARLLLLARAAGVEALYYFTADGCVERLHFHYGLWRGGTILPAAGAFAEAARRLERSRIDRIFENCDLHIMTFRHEFTGKLFCAVWSSSGKDYPVRLKGKSSEYRMTNLFGATLPLQEQNGKIEFKATSSPVYLESENLTAEIFRTRIAEAEKDFPPVKMSIRIISRNHIMILLRNLRSREVNGICRFAGSEQKFNLSPKAAKKLIFSAAAAGKTSEATVLAENFIVKEKVINDFRPCPYWKNFMLTSKDLPPSGHLPELKSFQYILPPDPSVGYKGPEDLSITSAAGYDEQYLYIAINVRDNIHFQPNTATRLYAGDSIQLAIDTLANAAKGECYDKDDYEFSFGLNNDGKSLVHLDYLYETGRRNAVLKSLRYHIFRHGNVCCYRIAIPWQSLKIVPAHGKIIGMNFIANDNDGFGRRFWMGLRPGIGEEKAPWRFLRFELLQKK